MRPRPKVFELTLWLALAALVASGKASSAQQQQQPGGLLGIAFQTAAPDEGGRERQTSESEARLEASLRRALLLRELELEGNAQARQLSERELVHRVRLNQLLDAISASIPTARGAAAAANLHSQASGAAPAPAARASSAPIFRSGRTYPSREPPASPPPAPPGDAYRRLRLAATDYTAGRAASQWDAGLLDGAPAASAAKGGRKSGILGIVWPNERPGGPPPPFYSNAAAAAAANRVDGVGLANIYGANQQRGRSGQPHERAPTPAASSSIGTQQQQQQQQQRHRVGSEEVALQGPLLRPQAANAGDYEWKRMEGSRWNNLRGMWGKRAALSDEELERLDASGERAAAGARASGVERGQAPVSGEARATDGDGGNDGGDDGGPSEGGGGGGGANGGGNGNDIGAM